MLVTAGADSAPASCTIDYFFAVFFGTTAKNGSSGNPITDSDILLAAKNLQTSRNLSLSNFGGGNTRLLFSWPTSFGTPSFKINGLANTAFTKVRAGSNFTNAFGGVYACDVWLE